LSLLLLLLLLLLPPLSVHMLAAGPPVRSTPVGRTMSAA
jgi:hypothetical protein